MHVVISDLKVRLARKATSVESSPSVLKGWRYEPKYNHEQHRRHNRHGPLSGAMHFQFPARPIAFWNRKAWEERFLDVSRCFFPHRTSGCGAAPTWLLAAVMSWHHGALSFTSQSCIWQIRDKETFHGLQGCCVGGVLFLFSNLPFLWSSFCFWFHVGHMADAG